MDGHTKTFYRNLWKVISSEQSNFYTDSQRDSHTYLDLRNNILRCCALLKSHRQEKIAILCDKNFSNYCAILGILLSGNIWVPLSKSTPKKRNLEILHDLGAKILVTDHPISISEIKNNRLQDLNIITPESIFECDTKIIPFPKINYKAEHISMIYYTSGSTGKPKGVMIKNKSFVNNISNIMNIVKPTKLRFIDLHDLSFVISIPIIFPCILSRSQLFCANSDLDILLPAKVIIREKINMLITVPSTLKRVVIDVNSKKAINLLDTVISCGEPLSFNILASFLEKKGIDFFNFYGSTEVAPWIFFHKCSNSTLRYESNQNFVPIGDLLPNNEMTITEDGMLLIKGIQVTPGYIGHDHNSHLIKYDGSLWFPMQDVVEKYCGVYFCKGRIDGVLKIKGYRVHLSDIEMNLKKIKGVKECVCFSDQERIIAFVFSQVSVTQEDIFDEIKTLLPTYMMPSKIILGRRVPINKNGKIDRAKIRQML